jgi:hypothetical protein
MVSTRGTSTDQHHHVEKVNAQGMLWESLPPEMCLGLLQQLEAVDCLLDAPASFAVHASCAQSGSNCFKP